MSKKPSVPKGTRDFLPAQSLKRQYIFDTARQVFMRYGYAPIETPAMENLDTLLGKYGEEGDKLIFKITKRGEKQESTFNQIVDASAVTENFIPDLDEFKSFLSKEFDKEGADFALRYDLTVPFARFVVQNQNELSFPFKRYQIQPVWRADRPQKGRYREFYQCDVDVIGSDSLLNETELLCIIDDVFAELGLSDIQIRLNNRKILHGIAVATGLNDHFTTMTVAIDKLDKIGLDGVKQEMLRNGLPEAGVKKALALINLKSDTDQTLKMLSGALTGVEEAYKGIEEVRSVLKRLPEAVREKVVIDLTLARGLNYYTGAIIEVGHPDFPSSICGGGRYDDLTGIFGLQGMSGVGVSFGADRIYDLMEDKGLFNEVVHPGSDVLFVNFGEKEVNTAWGLAADLRAEGLSCEVYPDAAKMKKQMKYANDKSVHYVVIIGEEELKSGEATVKDMQSGEQSTQKLKELVAYLSGQVG